MLFPHLSCCEDELLDPVLSGDSDKIEYTSYEVVAQNDD
ncbi:hypothetical protein HISP_08425 [Haloarcula hispanica N601]|uniref:Uncharacterized protein n=1 Tax=Haloarcula hispanica N601 TaxID=1417673 RepID=V5TS48_HALHI|nr:hypothetical protein HISP_08425 [Haloarcula hispanica N601]